MVEVAVELVVELAMVLDVAGMVAATVAVGSSLVVGVVAKTLQNRHRFDEVQDPFDAVFHFHSLHLWLESIEAVTRRVNHFHSRKEKGLLQ